LYSHSLILKPWMSRANYLYTRKVICVRDTAVKENFDAHPTLQSRHPIYCRLAGLPSRTMPTSEHWIISRLAVLNPLSKVKNNGDERGERIADTVVAKGVPGRATDSQERVLLASWI
jgi:hypothetical protein